MRMRHQHRHQILWLFAGMLAISLISVSTSQAIHAIKTETAVLETHSASGNFSFPYTYTVPHVSPSQGAQGIVGPTIPYSGIGIVSRSIGYSGQIGNSWKGYPFPKIPATVEFHVLNGTIQSWSNSVRTRIELVNTTTGHYFYNSTDTSGYANISVPEGSYIIQIVSTSRSFLNFSFQYYFNKPSERLTIYLMPSTYAIDSVSSRGSGVLWVKQRVNWGSNVSMPQLEIELLNASSSDSVIGVAYTGSNGSAEFTGLNSLYSYAVRSVGDSNPLTGFYYGMTNETSAPFLLSGAVTTYFGNDMFGISRSTALLTNITVPRSNGLWNISQPAIIEGGTTYISSPIDFKAQMPLKIENATVYFNESYSIIGSPSSITFINSSIVFLGENTYLLQNSTSGNIASALNSQFIGMDLRDYSGVTLHFLNVSDSVFFGLRSDGKSFISGNFYNDLISNSSGFTLTGDKQTYSNLTHVTILNSLLLNGVRNYGTIEMIDTAMFNSSTNISAERVYLNNSLLNETIPYEHLPFYGSDFGFISVQFFNAVHSVFTVSAPSNVSFGSFVTNITPNNQNGAYPSSPYVVFSFPGTPGVKNFINFTASNLTRAFPPVNMNVQFGNYFTISNFYNDNLDYNYSFPQVDQIMKSYSSKPFLGGRISITFDSVMNINHSIINGGLGQRIVPYLQNGIPDYITNDLFPFTYDIQSYSFFRFFPSGQGGSYYVENNSFQYIFWNLSWWKTAQDGAGFTDIWMETLANASFAPGAIPTIYVNYNTFWSPGLGTGANGISGNVEFAKSGITGYVSHNIFENSPRYVLGIPNNYQFYFFIPHMDDILATAANVTISDDTFLNLTNLTVPIGTDQAYQHGGSGGNISLEGNQFYFYPAIGGISFINSSWAWGPGGYYGGQVDFPGGYGYNGSNIAYEIPMGYYTSLKLINSINGDYVFNTTVGQNATSPYVTNPNYQIRVPQQWSWAIEPDFTWNGTAYVAQYNGMGGPQPDLKWHGYLYTWAFELNMTYITVNSTNAPPIPLRWVIKNPNSQAMTVGLYAHNLTSGLNTLIESKNSSVSAINLTYTYNPALDGMKALFFVESSVSHTATSQLYSLSFLEKGLPTGTLWSVKIGQSSKESSSDVIQFSLPNGSYDYAVYQFTGWKTDNGSGTADIRGQNSTIALNFSPVLYTVNFIESSFADSNWSLTVGTLTENSISDFITVSLPNGTYALNVTPPAGYRWNGSPGSVTVSGTNVTIFLNFTKVNVSIQKRSGGWLSLIQNRGLAALIVAGAISAVTAAILISARTSKRKRN
jgi:hypothetical protein